jgi:PAS domain-containing protein
VIEFLSDHPGDPDDELLATTETIGSQIGHFVERGRAEEAARGREARHAGILDSALDCIITIDDGGRVLEFNAAAERTFGYRADDIVGLEMAELIVPPRCAFGTAAASRGTSTPVTRSCSTGESSESMVGGGVSASGTAFGQGVRDGERSERCREMGGRGQERRRRRINRAGVFLRALCLAVDTDELPRRRAASSGPFSWNGSRASKTPAGRISVSASQCDRSPLAQANLRAS